MDIGNDRAGYMPVYSSQQLIDTARAYVEKLFGSGKGLTDEK